jgi:hypothetical protein
VPGEIPRPGNIYRVSLEGTGHVLRGLDKRRLKEFQENVAGTSFFLALKMALGELLALPVV